MSGISDVDKSTTLLSHFTSTDPHHQHDTTLQTIRYFTECCGSAGVCAVSQSVISTSTSSDINNVPPFLSNDFYKASSDHS